MHSILSEKDFMNAPAQEELLTVEEAATRLKVDVETVRRWLRSGQLSGVKIGRLWRIPSNALLALTTAPAPPQQEAFPQA